MLLFIVLLSIIVVIGVGLLFVKVKRGYLIKGDLASVSVTVVFIGLLSISIGVSIWGYVISLIALIDN